MKIKLHHPTGHPYWQRNKFKVEMPDGTFLDLYNFNPKEIGEVEVYVEKSGIYVQYFHCSSGGGKTPFGSRHLLLKLREYDVIEYVGTPLELSESLKSDLRDNQIK